MLGSNLIDHPSYDSGLRSLEPKKLRRGSSRLQNMLMGCCSKTICTTSLFLWFWFFVPRRVRGWAERLIIG